jgi:hypothetical protein
MNLRQQAAADLENILGDAASGFGWPITVTSPQLVSAELTGFSTDISLVIDPQTGVAVSGRRVSVALSISRLREAGLDIPRGVAAKDSKPWIVVFNDIGGSSHKFKVSASSPDLAAGLVTCALEMYR